MSSTPESVGRKVRETWHEAPSQGGESASKAGTPWIHPGEVSENAVTGGRFPTGLTRVGAYVLFNPFIEVRTWAAFPGLRTGRTAGSTQNDDGKPDLPGS